MPLCVRIESHELVIEMDLLNVSESPSIEELRLIESIWPELTAMMRELAEETQDRMSVCV